MNRVISHLPIPLFPIGRSHSSRHFAVGPLLPIRYRLMRWSLFTGYYGDRCDTPELPSHEQDDTASTEYVVRSCLVLSLPSSGWLPGRSRNRRPDPLRCAHRPSRQSGGLRYHQPDSWRCFNRSSRKSEGLRYRQPASIPCLNRPSRDFPVLKDVGEIKRPFPQYNADGPDSPTYSSFSPGRQLRSSPGGSRSLSPYCSIGRWSASSALSRNLCSLMSA